MYIINIIILALTLYFIKYISFTFALFFLVAQLEAIRKYRAPAFYDGHRYTCCEIRPVTYSSMPDDLPIGTMIFHKY
jgi:hypothetical protein